MTGQNYCVRDDQNLQWNVPFVMDSKISKSAELDSKTMLQRWIDSRHTIRNRKPACLHNTCVLQDDFKSAQNWGNSINLILWMVWNPVRGEDQTGTLPWSNKNGQFIFDHSKFKHFGWSLNDLVWMTNIFFGFLVFVTRPTTTPEQTGFTSSRI